MSSLSNQSIIVRKQQILKNFESDIFNIKQDLRQKTSNTQSNQVNQTNSVSSKFSNGLKMLKEKSPQKFLESLSINCNTSNNASSLKVNKEFASDKRKNYSNIEFNINSNRNKETYKYPIEQKIKKLNKETEFQPKYNLNTPLERKNKDLYKNDTMGQSRIKKNHNKTKSGAFDNYTVTLSEVNIAAQNSKGLIKKELSLNSKPKVNFNNPELSAFQRKIAQEYNDSTEVCNNFNTYKKSRNQEDQMIKCSLGITPLNYNAYNTEDIRTNKSDIFFCKDKDRSNSNLKLCSQITPSKLSFNRCNPMNNFMDTGHINLNQSKTTKNNKIGNSISFNPPSENDKINSKWISKLDWKTNNIENIFNTSKTLTNKAYIYTKNAVSENFPLKCSTEENEYKKDKIVKRAFPKSNKFIQISYDCNQIFSKNVDSDFIKNSNKDDLKSALETRYGSNTSKYRKNYSLASTKQGGDFFRNEGNLYNLYNFMIMILYLYL